jgi:hypothetical protein
VLAGRAYVLSATCTGYYPFGRLGERLMVNVQDGKLSKIRMAMVPIKVGVIITAKEMMPARDAQKHRYETLVTRASNHFFTHPRSLAHSPTHNPTH